MAGVIDPNADTRLEHLLKVIAEAVPDAVLVVNERTEPRPADADPPPARTDGPVPRSPAEHADFLEEVIWTKEATSSTSRSRPRRPTQQDLDDSPAEDPLSL